MRCEIINIGNEVLRGVVPNTNAAHISKFLSQHGLQVDRHSVFPDEYQAVKEGISEALKRCDALFITGGLGPTLDDITRQVVADLFDSPLVFDESIAKDLRRRYGGRLISLENQATVPSKAIIIPNHYGTAQGLLFEENHKKVVLLPGVPEEMRAMLNDSLVEKIMGKISRKKIHSEILNFYEMKESEIDPLTRELAKKHPGISFGIYPFAGVVSIHLHSSEPIPQDIIDHLLQEFGDRAFESEKGDIAEAVHHQLIRNKKTLAIAESCTGGFLASRITQIPGASEYFWGSIVAYHDEIKQRILGVKRETLENHGAVSEEIAVEMAEGVIKLSDCDIGLAVTGIAGPGGGSPQKPVGTVWCAIKLRDQQAKTKQLQLIGNREMIITRSTNALFAMVLFLLKL